jgi:hypothetical protein
MVASTTLCRYRGRMDQSMESVTLVDLGRAGLPGCLTVTAIDVTSNEVEQLDAYDERLALTNSNGTPSGLVSTGEFPRPERQAAFARRIASFDKVAVAGIKELLDVATLPPDDGFGPGLAAYFATAGRAVPSCSVLRQLECRPVR